MLHFGSRENKCADCVFECHIFWLLLVMDALLIGKSGREKNQKKARSSGRSTTMNTEMKWIKRSKAYNQIEMDCEVCGGKVKKNKWARHVKREKHRKGVDGGRRWWKSWWGYGGDKGWAELTIRDLHYNSCSPGCLNYQQRTSNSGRNLISQCELHQVDLIFKREITTKTSTFWVRTWVSTKTLAVGFNPKK